MSQGAGGARAPETHGRGGRRASAAGRASEGGPAGDKHPSNTSGPVSAGDMRLSDADKGPSVAIGPTSTADKRPSVATGPTSTADKQPSAAGKRPSDADKRPSAATGPASGSTKRPSAASAAGKRRAGAAALEAALDQLGPFGLYQRYTLLMLCIPNFLAAMYSLNYIFVAEQVPFRCVVPECEGTADVSYESPAAALLPAEPCRRPAPLAWAPGDNLTCAPESFHPHNTLDCDARVYEHTRSIYAEFDLGCREWLRALVGTVRNSALPLALVLTGYISDSFGRRTAFCLFAACAGVLGVVKGFSVNYQMYLVMEFLEAALGYGFTSAAYVMIVELARPSLRVSFASASGVAYGLGGAALAAAAAAGGGWRRLLWGLHAPALLLPLYWLLLDDSCRWLHATGRRDRAAQVVRKAARWNKVTVDEDMMRDLLEQEDSVKEGGAAGRPWRRLVRSRALLVRFAACAWCWASAAFVYYGLTINSVSLAGERHVNFALNMAMEVVASLLVMMALERFGRKWSIFCAFLLCGLVCVAPFVISAPGAALGLYFTGKLAVTFAFNSLYVFTAELFPTRARSSALAACSLLGRAGSILAPLSPLLEARVQAVLYGACAGAAALAVLLMPETRRAPLPHDVAAAEGLAAPAPPPPPPPPAPAPRVFSADT